MQPNFHFDQSSILSSVVHHDFLTLNGKVFHGQVVVNVYFQKLTVKFFQLGEEEEHYKQTEEID